MFSLAAAAAAQAANPPLRKPRPTAKRRESTGGITTSNRGKKSFPWGSNHQSYPQAAPIPGVKPILKKQDTSTRSSATAVTLTEDDIDIDASRNGLKVQFSNLDIAEHKVELGDCPYCDGPPLSLSNQCVNRSQMTLDSFEENKRSLPRKKKGKRLAMEPWERSELLLSMGYSIQEVADAAVETHMNRLQLAQSLQNRKWDSFNSIGEHLRRSLVSSSSKKGSQQSL